MKAYFAIVIRCSRLRFEEVILSIKSIIINECQHKSTRVNTNQHESDTSQHESTRINTSQHESDRVNTNQHESYTSQHESKLVNTSQSDQETLIVYRSFSWLSMITI